MKPIELKGPPRTVKPGRESGAKKGLGDLGEVPLSPAYEAELAMWAGAVRGSPMWRVRKLADVRDLMALTSIASRLRIEMLDATTDLRAVLRLRCAVPCLESSEAELHVAKEAVLGLVYPEQALRVPLPGYAFVRILRPRDVFQPVVSRDDLQALCLGTTLPVALPVREILLAAYGALSMQILHIDERDPAGVMNAAAAVWWQQRPHLYPLSEVPFLSDEDLVPEQSS